MQCKTLGAFLLFCRPHYPLVVPQAFYDLYPLDKVSMPRNYQPEHRPKHPEVKTLAKFWNYDDYFDEQSVVKARAAYFGLCSYLDHHIGQVLKTLEETGQLESTRIILCADHGEMLGEKGFWGKSVMYEDAVGIPMIMSGPGIPTNHRTDTPVSLIDCYRTIIESAQGKPHEDSSSPSCSLIDIANGAKPDRTVISEYHDGGSTTGFFMVRMEQWKYVYYVDRPPQLFNLDEDPYEETDLGESPAHSKIRKRAEQKLRTICDPEKVNQQAFSDQALKIAELGGRQACLNYSAFNFTPLEH